MKLFLALAMMISVSAFAQALAPQANFCAIVENSKDSSRTDYLTINNGDRIMNLNRVQMSDGRGDWDNKISLVTVARGCAMIGYQYQNFNTDIRTGARLAGFAEMFANRSAAETKTFVLEGVQNDTISSLKCVCK